MEPRSSRLDLSAERLTLRSERLAFIGVLSLQKMLYIFL